MNWRCKTIAVLLTLAVLQFACSKGPPATDLFVANALDAPVPGADPWGKGIADLNDDGLAELLVSNHGSGDITVWFAPAWRREVIVSGQPFATDVEVADINRDGHVDIIAISDDELQWIDGITHAATLIERRPFHDVAIADLNADGLIDIVARDQSEFGGKGEEVVVYLHQPGERWQIQELTGPKGEGLALADVNGDSRVDIIVNGTWFRNHKAGTWSAFAFAPDWKWPSTVVATGDIDSDGDTDILLTPSEPAGQRYHVSWFSNPEDSTLPWAEHIVLADTETVLHSAGIADFDLDGQTDIVIAEMHQGKDPDQVLLLRNAGAALHWETLLIADAGSHSLQIADIEGDGDMDLFGANWSGPEQQPVLWVNQTCPSSALRWRRHVLDEQRPDARAPLVQTVDLDGDGLKDVLTGGYWYRNPGRGNMLWHRSELGFAGSTLITSVDTDGDNDMDVLVFDLRGDRRGDNRQNHQADPQKDVRRNSTPPTPRMIVLENTGHGEFKQHVTAVQASADFLQGVATAPGPDGAVQIALSWHKAGAGVELLQRAPGAQEVWTLEKISPESQDEALSAGDIDGDGDVDLLQGTKWLRRTPTHWVQEQLENTVTPPDRNTLADINNDGRLDAVVGYEAISEVGDIVWFRQPAAPTQPWERHLIGRVIGPMSLGTADLDRDGDIDVVVGEHNLQEPGNAALWVFENVDGTGLQWDQHLVFRGDEHHDGALTGDMDNDGDVDIVSIGWGHQKVLYYENTTPHCH